MFLETLETLVRLIIDYSVSLTLIKHNCSESFFSIFYWGIAVAQILWKSTGLEYFVVNNHEFLNSFLKAYFIPTVDAYQLLG